MPQIVFSQIESLEFQQTNRMNYMKGATAPAMETMSQQQQAFDMENKVRTIVADMLLNMDDKLNKQIRELKGSQNAIQSINMKVQEVNTNLQKEAKMKDLIDNLKLKIQNMERGMASSIDKAVEGNDALNCQLNDMDDRINKIVQERGLFVKDLTKTQLQIKDYENFMNQFRGHHDREMISLKAEVTKTLDASRCELEEMVIDRRQLRAMVKNQNFHYTQLQQEIGVIKNRITNTEKTCEEVPGLIEYTEVTDTYLQNYLPTEIYAEVHKAMQITLASAPTKMRLDQIDYSNKRMREALERVAQIGTLTQETFIKNEFNPLKLDFDAYSIRMQYEDEQKEAQEKEKREASQAVTRKTSGSLFREKMYTKQNLKDLAQQMELRLVVPMKKLVTKGIDDHSWMKKLIEFYEEECGSDSDTGRSSGADDSDLSSDSESGSSEASEASGGEESSDSVISERANSSKKPSSRDALGDEMVIASKSSISAKINIDQQISQKSSQPVVQSAHESSKAQIKQDQQEVMKSSFKSVAEKIVTKQEDKASLPDMKQKKQQQSAQKIQTPDADENVSEVVTEKRSSVMTIAQPVGDDIPQMPQIDQLDLDLEVELPKQKTRKVKRDRSSHRTKESKKSKKTPKEATILVDDVVIIADEQDMGQISVMDLSNQLAGESNLVITEKSEKKIVIIEKTEKKDKKEKHKKKKKQKKEKSKNRSTSIDDQRESASRAQAHSTMMMNQQMDQIKNAQQAELQATLKAIADMQNQFGDLVNKNEDQKHQLEEMKKLQERKDELELAVTPLEMKEDKQMDDQLAKLKDRMDEIKTDNKKSRLSKSPNSRRKSKMRKNRKHDESTHEMLPDLNGGMSKAPRGAKANAAAFETINRQLEQFVTLDQHQETIDDMQRAMASITVFKAQMKIFEKKFMSEQNSKVAQVSAQTLLHNTAKAFAKLPTNFTDSDKLVAGMESQENVKKTLHVNLNRIDLLTDAKIGDIKGLMKTMTDQIITLNKRVQLNESELYKKMHEDLPLDVMALTKTEVQLRTELANMIGKARETQDWTQKEFKRLRREHYGNLKDIEQILLSYDQLSGRVKNVIDRQGLNDQAMASIFKIMRLDHALDEQDETDKQSLYLMGLTNSNQGAAVDKILDELQQKSSLATQYNNGTGRVLSLGADLRSVMTPEPASGIKPVISRATATAVKRAPTEIHTEHQTSLPAPSIMTANQTGKFVKKLRASTRIPIEHKISDGDNNGDWGNRPRGVKVLSLDRNCQTCQPGNHNEVVMKAFKMACLQYQPSPVNFEQQNYKRDELINAKNYLLKYCLSQLKHLDLGVLDRGQAVDALNHAWSNISQKQDNERVNYAEFDPSKVPGWPADGSRYSSDGKKNGPVDWLNQDSIESLKQVSGGFSLPTAANREAIRLNNARSPFVFPQTQRGRCGKLADSQMYQNLMTGNPVVVPRTSSRQAFSLSKHQDDETFDDQSIVGRNIVQPNAGSRRAALVTQGSPVEGQVTSYRLKSNRQRINVRTQGADKGISRDQASDQSYMNNQGESTVNSSTQARLKYGSVKGTMNMAVGQNLRTLQHSLDSSIVTAINSGAATPHCGIISPLSGAGVTRSIHLPSLQEENRMLNAGMRANRHVVRNSMQSSSIQNALEISNVDKGSQNSFLQMTQDGLSPINMADTKQVDLD